jgi:uncharacterized protein
MIGTIINAVGILAGGMAGMRPAWQFSPARQHLLKVGLGVFTVYTGLKLCYTGLNGSIWGATRIFLISLLAMTLGRLLGKLLRLQKTSNRLGKFARHRMEVARPDAPGRFASGFLVGAALFCAAPLAVLGAVADGMDGVWHLLAIKAVMDGLAAMAFVPVFGAGVLLAALPVTAWQGLLTMGVQALMAGGYLSPSMLDAVRITCGLLAFSVALVVLEIKRVELADYLPSLVLAPLLVKWIL